jgi:hypothetical protein
MDEIRVNLARCDERPFAAVLYGSELVEKCGPVLSDHTARILLGEAEVQALPSVNLGAAAWPRAERVNEPGNRSKRISLQEFGLPFSVSLAWHQTILTMCPRV